MKKKKPHDKLRYKNKVKKNQIAAHQEDKRIIDESFDKMERRISEMTGIEHKIMRDESSVSMSETLLEFASPLIEAIDPTDREAYKRTVSTAIFFWNCAVLREKPGKEKEIKKLLKSFMKNADSKDIVNDMMERKRQLFPDINRYIINYELVDQGDAYHISVASTFEPKKM